MADLEARIARLEATESADKDTRLNGYEIRILWMMDGGPELPWGGAMGVACEYLAGRGFCTRGPNFHITDAGRQALAAIKSSGGRDHG